VFNITDGASAPVQFAADLHRRYPTAWKRFDEARAARSSKLQPTPVTWLTHEEAFGAFVKLRDEQNIDHLPVEALCDLYALASWRVTQGVYKFDDDLLRALADTPLDISLPASLLTRLPEWAVYVETPGFTHHGKPIVGMIATLFDAPSGLSLMLTLIPKTIVSIDADVDRIQLHLTDMPLRERLIRDIGAGGMREADFRETLDAVSKMNLPATKVGEIRETLSDAVHDTREAVLDSVLAELVPFISLVLYLSSEEPDLERRPTLPTGKLTKRGLRFFAPNRPQVWPVGMRVGAALRAARNAHDAATKSERHGVRPHWRKAHWHSFWTGSRNVETRALKVRWLMPVAVNVKTDDVLPAVVHPVNN
jgi:hypothetical protein